MPKNEQSAAQRREQVREQRQQRQTTNQNIQSRNSGNIRKKSDGNRNTWYLIGGILLMCAVVIGGFIFLSQQQAASTQAQQVSAFQALTKIDPKLLATVGSGNAKNLMVAVKGNPPLLKGPTGKPEFFYVGGEYCPYCAAQRWGVIVALSRFGTFGPVPAITSSEGSVPTFSFHNVTYQSQYIDFVAREQADNKNQPLDTLTAEQKQTFSKYDAPPYVDAQSAGSIPFIDIADRYVSAGAYYPPTTLVGLTYPDIEKQILDPTTDVSKGVLGTANYLTAAICEATNNQPASVCGAEPIPTLQSSLPKVTSSGLLPLAIANNPYEAVTRREG
ncbi:MAG TPA: DUF929 family protein [Ktedonosporobacter sp.]|nr:DUF929 family protein [Ktedonosporobacter sp.]